MGENAIAEKTREQAKICGWKNWEECTNHGLRAMGVTILHNNNKINLTNLLTVVMLVKNHRIPTIVIHLLQIQTYKTL